MPQADQYELHMLSFKRKDGNGYNVAFGNGGNLQGWHLEILAAWLAQQCQLPDGAEDLA